MADSPATAFAGRLAHTPHPPVAGWAIDAQARPSHTQARPIRRLTFP